MSRIAATFVQLQASGRKALIPYVTAGFPFSDVTPLSPEIPVAVLGMGTCLRLLAPGRDGDRVGGGTAG